ncbi:MAG: photosystem I reaction center subunit XII [Xenococcus sp. MO_188.B8]|nr:photosystem I reaction center subunit XII [Xenococcus sp. MO_188.B8]
MPVTETQVIVAIIISLFPAFLALRLGTELYK